MPKIESAMLRPLYEAMEQIYTGDARSTPFAWFGEITCPVTISTAGRSGLISKEMASRAAALIPQISERSFAGVGAGQEYPTLSRRPANLRGERALASRFLITESNCIGCSFQGTNPFARLAERLADVQTFQRSETINRRVGLELSFLNRDESPCWPESGRENAILIDHKCYTSS